MSPDLSRWSNQGVLMLNTALTTEINKAGSHLKIWKPFVNYLLDMLSSNFKDLVFIFLGKKAENFEDLISDDHAKLFTTHPAYAAYNKLKTWECHDVFNKANQILEEKKIQKITW